MSRGRWSAAIFCLFAGLYLLSLGRGFGTSDGEVMFLTTAALAERGSLALAPDPALPQIVPGTRGAYYGKYDPGLPLLAVPFYLAGEALAAVNHAHRYGTAALAVLLIPALAAAGTVAGLGWLAVRLPSSPGVRWRVWGLLLAAGLATPLWVYARTLFAEAVLACALTWAVGLASRIPESPPHRAEERLERRAGLFTVALAGLMLGAGITVRAAFVIYALPLAVMIARQSGSQRRAAIRLGVWAVGTVPGIALVLVANMARFGSPFLTGYGGEAFSTRPWQGIAGLGVSPGRGVLWFAPPLVLSALLWRRWRCSGREARLLADGLALAWVVAFVFYGAWWAWHGGWAWGPRLLTPLLPLSLLPWLALPEGRGWRIAAAGLIAAGALINGAGVLVDVTPHFAATVGATGSSGAYWQSSWRVGDSMVGYAVGEAAAGRVEPRALARLGDLGLPLTWRIGLPGAAIGLILVGWRGAIRYEPAAKERSE